MVTEIDGRPKRVFVEQAFDLSNISYVDQAHILARNVACY